MSENCQVHNKSLSKFCFKCFEEVCDDCKSKHKGHDLLKNLNYVYGSDVSAELKKDQQKFYSHCIGLKPDFANAYFNLSVAHSNSGADNNESEKLLLKAIELNPKDPEFYMALGLSMESEHINVNGTVLTEQQIYGKAISVDPNNAMAYSCLASTALHFDQMIEFNGVSMSASELHSKSIDLDPLEASIYYNIAVSMDEFDSILNQQNEDDEEEEEEEDKIFEMIFKHHDKDYSKEELLLKCLEIDPTYYRALIYLSYFIGFDEDTITLPDNSKPTKIELLIKSIEINDTDPEAYLALSDIVSEYFEVNESLKAKYEDFTFANGVKMETRSLLIKAIDLQPTMVSTYCDLAFLLTSFEEEITLLDGTSYTKSALYAKAKEIDQDEAYQCFYEELKVTNKSEIILPNNEKLTLDIIEEYLFGAEDDEEDDEEDQ